MEASHFHADDLVLLDGRIGVVERTHADVDTHVPDPARGEYDSITRDPSISQKIFYRFLRDGIPPSGYAFVRLHETPEATLVLESRLVLLDRSLLIGDVVKRNTRDAMSGVVINTSAKCVLKTMGDVQVTGHPNKLLKGFLPPNDYSAQRRSPSGSLPPQLVDIPASELKYDDDLNEDDIVIHKHRLGRVQELRTNVTLRLCDNCVVEIDDELAEHVEAIPDLISVGDIVRTKKSALRTGRWIYGRYNPNTPPEGTVVARRAVAADVDWLTARIGSPENDNEWESTLERDDLESDQFMVYDRTKYPKRSTAPNTVSYSEIDARIGLRVRFKDLSGACVKYDGSTRHGKLVRMDRKDFLGYDLNVFEITSFRTDVFVQWQDLSISQEASTNLIPDSSIDDEHAAWPGEIAHTLDFTPVADEPFFSRPSKTGVVQTVNASERMATLKWCPNGKMQYYDNEDDDEASKRQLLEAVVGHVGEEIEELSLYDIEAPGKINVRRGDIVLLMREAQQSLRGDLSQRNLVLSEKDWLGEIVDTRLDGYLTVRLGAVKPVRDVQVPREHVQVAIRSDGTDQPDEWDDGDDASEDMSVDESNPDLFDDEDEEAQAKYEDENGMALDEEEVENGDWESDASDQVAKDIDMIGTDTPPTSHSTTPTVLQHRMDPTTTASNANSISQCEPELYLVLEGTPPSGHHFADEPPTENTAHMKRAQKEHRILRGSLPSGVYVRTWEARMDLLRVLFVGPDDTPYARAPFVCDFYLGPLFPMTPPQAFFHSWPAYNGMGGVGRVNPNLYEDGKICLSLLGTWEGSKGEGWSATRSTLLQVIVSLLGLVLVREPYFNEAGYEPLAGLESSKRPSALYNERTSLRATGFIIKAIDFLKDCSTSSGIEGLEDVVAWLYQNPKGSKLLQKTIDQVESILQHSQGGVEEPDGITTMSKGACILLKRILDSLKVL